MTTELLSAGLADSYQWPKLSIAADHVTVGPATGVTASVLRARSYEELYEDQLTSQSYNALLPDGALLQLSYRLEADMVVRHRLCYLPSPYHAPYEEDPDVYIGSELFAEIVGEQYAIVPLRFDFDRRPEAAVEGTHPVSHLTLGQYKNCRVPVSGPVSPGAFLDFVLSHFYSSAWSPLKAASVSRLGRMGDTLSANELSETHLRIRLER